MSILKTLLSRIKEKDLLINTGAPVGERLQTFEVNRSLIDKIAKSNCLAIELSLVLKGNAPELIMRGINKSANGLSYQIKKYSVSDEKIIDLETGKKMSNKFKERYGGSSNKSMVSGFVIWSKTMESLPAQVEKIKLSLFYYQPAHLFYLRFDNLEGVVLLNISSESRGMASGLPCPPFCDSDNQ